MPTGVFLRFAVQRLRMRPACNSESRWLGSASTTTSIPPSPSSRSIDPDLDEQFKSPGRRADREQVVLDSSREFGHFFRELCTLRKIGGAVVDPSDLIVAQMGRRSFND